MIVGFCVGEKLGATGVGAAEGKELGDAVSYRSQATDVAATQRGR